MIEALRKSNLRLTLYNLSCIELAPVDMQSEGVGSTGQPLPLSKNTRSEQRRMMIYMVQNLLKFSDIFLHKVR